MFAREPVDPASPLFARPDVVVATPGRIIDHVRNSQSVDLDDVEILVLDEADRMVDMGFENELNFVLDSMAGLLKSEAEDEAYEQEEAAKRGEALFFGEKMECYHCHGGFTFTDNILFLQAQICISFLS